MEHWKFTGDELKTRENIKRAERELNIHRDAVRLGNLSQHRSRRVFGDGLVVECQTVFKDEIVKVYYAAVDRNKSVTKTRNYLIAPVIYTENYLTDGHYLAFNFCVAVDKYVDRHIKGDKEGNPNTSRKSGNHGVVVLEMEDVSEDIISWDQSYTTDPRTTGYDQPVLPSTLPLGWTDTENFTQDSSAPGYSPGVIRALDCISVFGTGTNGMGIFLNWISTDENPFYPTGSRFYGLNSWTGEYNTLTVTFHDVKSLVHWVINSVTGETIRTFPAYTETVTNFHYGQFVSMPLECGRILRTERTNKYLYLDGVYWSEQNKYIFAFTKSLYEGEYISSLNDDMDQDPWNAVTDEYGYGNFANCCDARGNKTTGDYSLVALPEVSPAELYVTTDLGDDYKVCDCTDQSWITVVDAHVIKDSPTNAVYTYAISVIEYNTETKDWDLGPAIVYYGIIIRGKHHKLTITNSVLYYDWDYSDNSCDFIEGIYTSPEGEEKIVTFPKSMITLRSNREWLNTIKACRVLGVTTKESD